MPLELPILSFHIFDMNLPVKSTLLAWICRARAKCKFEFISLPQIIPVIIFLK